MHLSVDSHIPLFRLIGFSGFNEIFIYFTVLFTPFFTKNTRIGKADGIFAADARLQLRLLIPVRVLELFLNILHHNRKRKII